MGNIYGGVCKICSMNFGGLTAHLRNYHSDLNLNLEEYYWRYLRNSDKEGVCENCGSRCKFTSIARGFTSICTNRECTKSCICLECGANQGSGFRLHIEIVHKMTAKEYYDKYFKKPGEGICAYCKSPTKFSLIFSGFKNFKYRLYCSESNGSCSNKDYWRKLFEIPGEREKYCKENSESRKKWWTEHPEMREEYSIEAVKQAMDPEFLKKSNTSIKSWHTSNKVKDLYSNSSWELRAYQLLDLDTTVETYERGPVINYSFNNEIHRYMSDMLVLYKDGSKRIIEVKRNDLKFEDPNPAKYKAACIYSKELGYLPFKVWDYKWLW